LLVDRSVWLHLAKLREGAGKLGPKQALKKPSAAIV
jgi:hypothetical protein